MQGWCEWRRDGAAPEARAKRDVYFDEGWVETPIYDRAGLHPAMAIDGPLVVEEFGSTTVVLPGQALTVEAHGILIIRPRGELK